MNILPELIDALGLTNPWAYAGLFLAASLLMLWRLEAMLDHGLEGTALGTLVMPYCSGLGNLIFVSVMLQRDGEAREVMTNCLVNNVTNLTLLLGVPAVAWGLSVVEGARKSAPGKGKAKGKAKGRAAGGDAGTVQRINRLSLGLTLIAVVFFSGAVWALGQDGRLDRIDGLMLIGAFLFWQCIQVFDVMKHNVRQKLSFGFLFYLDAIVVLAGAYGLYVSIDWLVEWLTSQRNGFISGANLGWLSGWLLVLPNALLAIYWAWKRRADIVFSSQVGDGHICIPLCLGIFALVRPIPVSGFDQDGLLLLVGAAVVHMALLFILGGLPRWAGGVLIAAYGWFVWTGLAG